MARPIFEAKKNGIQVAVWGSVDRASISITKRYKDKATGEYKDSKYFYPDNCRDLIGLLTESLEWLQGQNAIGTVETVQVLGTTLNIKTNDNDEIPW